MSARDKLQALLDGKTLVEPVRYSGMKSAEIKLKGDDLWMVDCNNPNRKNTPMLVNDMGMADIVNWTIKPEVILINGFEVSTPINQPLIKDTTYFYPILNNALYSSTSWTEDSYDIIRLELGIIHLTKEAAIAHAKALLSFTETSNERI